MSIFDTFSKLFTFPNIMFAGIPFLAGYGLMFYSMGKNKVDRNLLVIGIIFSLTSLLVHVLHDIHNGDDESILLAGSFGYAAVALILIWINVKKYTYGKH